MKKISLLIMFFIGLLLVNTVSALPPDNDNDGCVSIGEISAYVSQWLNGQVSLNQVSIGVSWWINGCTQINNTNFTFMTGTQFLGSDRAIDWNPGIPGGIPNYPVGVNALSYGAIPNDGLDDSQAIRDALAATSQDTAVLLPAGEYNILSSIPIPAHKVLRGEGWDNTIIRCNMENQTCISMNNFPGSVYVAMTGGYVRGSTQIQVESTSSISAGEYVELRQDVDFTEFICGYNGCAESIPGWGEVQVGQIIKVISVNSATNTVTLERPLYYTYKANLNPRLRSYPKIEYAGIEDLYLHRVNWAGYGAEISMAGAAKCWIRGIWSQYTLSEHVNVVGSTQVEIRDSVFNDAHVRGGGGQGYGIIFESHSTDNLVENNIFNHLRHSMVVHIGSTGNVFAYDYSANPQGANSGNNSLDNWLFPDALPHGHFPYANLWEGNVVQNIAIDNVWGTNAMTTFFRNRILRTSDYVPNTNSAMNRFPFIHIAQGNSRNNIIGNEIGTPGQVIVEYPGRYTIATSLTGSIIIWVSMNTTDTLIHGNYEYLNGRYQLSATNDGWEDYLGGANAQMPTSLYLEEKPSWWTPGLSWPAFGPEYINSGNKIPAQVKFEQLKAQGKI